jgi:glycosyltransferase involved in cell wall biosynthesis
MAKIIVSSTQYPYYGGSATNSYALIKFLRAGNHKVVGLFFTDEKVDVDPDKIGGIWQVKNNKGSHNLVRKLTRGYLGGSPSIVFGKNYAAPVMSKGLFPSARIIYLVTGSPQMIEASNDNLSAKKYLKRKGSPIVHKPEKDCIVRSDLVVPNSQMARRLLVKNYGEMEKFYSPIDTSLAFNRKSLSSVPFHKRKTDILFICSNLSRKVKNAELARRIFSNPLFSEANKTVIGLNSGKFRNISKTTCRGLLPHNKVIDEIKDSKLVVCTSYYDASPNVIKEALMCESNILISKNCGWSELYPEEFVCNDVYSIKEWVIKANRLISGNINFNLSKASMGLNLLEDLNEVINE